MFSSQNSQVSSDANYIEDVFSTYLYTGNGSTQTITNGIDLSGEGGLVWVKMRSNGSATGNVLFDTVRGASQKLETNSTGASSNWTPYGVSAFGSTGFTVADDGAGNYITNNSGVNYASWTFREQAKFFDVVTWTGDGSNKTISHSLGSTPGCIIAKRTDSAGSWYTYHRSLSTPNESWLLLNTTGASNTTGGTNVWNVTSTTFQADTYFGLSTSGATYVAYVFAHDAGGFGLTGTDNVISCGSFTTDGSGNATVNLGYEPQFVLWKKSDGPVNGYSNWQINDSMRGFTTDQGAQDLYANSSSAEASTGANFGCSPTSTGFKVIYEASKTYIYIAIRRGPMKVPTSGTSVFAPVLTTTNNTITTNFPVDLSIFKADKTTTSSNLVFDRLRGNTARLVTSTTGAEATATAYPLFDSNTGTAITGFSTGLSGIDWAFRRAPSFFDEVCDSTGGPTIYHNLGVAPELIIAKVRNYSPQDWFVDVPSLGSTRTLNLNTTGAASSTNYISSPTATQFTTTLGGGGYNYVYYLFATCAGVQYINSYVGDGTTGRTINCGFTGGARFVCIKATSTSGSWWTFDSARGIVTNNDPALQLNSSAAEVTSADAIDTASSGFIVNQEATCSLNASGVTYLVWAIA
jgi:hypothetical protein